MVLEFPIDTEADTVQKAQALPEEEETTSPLSGMKFLCAEDNAINAEILQMLLETKGASCTICPTVRRSWMPLPASSPAITT